MRRRPGGPAAAPAAAHRANHKILAEKAEQCGIILKMADKTSLLGEKS